MSDLSCPYTDYKNLISVLLLPYLGSGFECWSVDLSEIFHEF